MASALADFFRFSPDQRRRIVICGIGAGFAAVFGTPVAEAILGIEVLAIGDLWYVPSVAASVMSYELSGTVGLTWFYPTTTAQRAFTTPAFDKIASARRRVWAGSVCLSADYGRTTSPRTPPSASAPLVASGRGGFKRPHSGSQSPIRRTLANPAHACSFWRDRTRFWVLAGSSSLWPSPWASV